MSTAQGPGSDNATLKDKEIDTEKGQNGDNSSDEQKGDEPDLKTPVGFWDHRLHHVKVEAFSKWALTTVVLMVFILAVLSIYWATLFRVEENLEKLTVYVVDFDGQAPYGAHTPIVGPAVMNTMLESVKESSHLGFVSYPPSHFGNDPIAVRQAVFDQYAWAAIIINANATDMLYSAVQNGNASYDPLGACQLVFIDSRDDTNWYDFIMPTLTPLLTEATSMTGEMFTRTILGQAQTNPTLLANMAKAPQALSPSIGFSMYNLRPFYPYQTIPAISVGLIYLIIISFFSFSFYLPIHFKYLKPEGHPPLKFYQLIIWRWSATIVAYLFLSGAYSLLSLAFQINFSGGNPVTSETEPTIIAFGNADAYGKGTWPVYWMLNFLGMMALGLACENVAMLAGQPWTGLWLIFWVITNVSTGFYSIAVESSFFRWGFAWPLHNIVEASRIIIFGLSDKNIGTNFGVLAAWAVVNTAFFPVCCYYMRWKTQKGLHEYWA